MRIKNATRLTGQERHAIICALEIAVEVYRQDACKARLNSANLRIAEQFERQEKDARALVEKLEQYEDTHTLMLVDEG